MVYVVGLHGLHCFAGVCQTEFGNDAAFFSLCTSFPHLAFPHSPTPENTPKQHSFHGRMDGRLSLVLCADTTAQCRMSEKPTTSPGIVSELATNREWSF